MNTEKFILGLIDMGLDREAAVWLSAAVVAGMESDALAKAIETYGLAQVAKAVEDVERRSVF